MMNQYQMPVTDMMARGAASERMSCKELSDWIAMLGFCAIDMMLYLDTHPDDREALEYFNQCDELCKSAKKVYEERFGTLDVLSGKAMNGWDWNAAPMPWEGGR